MSAIGEGAGYSAHKATAQALRKETLLPDHQIPTFVCKPHDRPGGSGVRLDRSEAPSSLRNAGSDEGGVANNDAAFGFVFAVPPK